MKLERTLISRCSAEGADAASGWQGWADRSPSERLTALESLRAFRIALRAWPS